MKILIKRIYEPAKKSDGKRILVDRLWPRGLTKQKAKVDYWAKGIAPSNSLRQWYKHDPKKWINFQKRYRAELKKNGAALKELKTHLKGRTITFVFGSKEEKLNNAYALKKFLVR